MYKIGEAAKLMRISTEALRYYERKGIIKPYKSEESKYRYFDGQQINHMLNMQIYQKFGFSLYEVGEMFQNCEDSKFQDLMITKQKELMKENLATSLRIHNIHSTLNHMRMAKLAEKDPILGVRPAIYRISYMDNGGIIANKELEKELAKWSLSSDLQFLSGFMSFDNFKKRLNFREYGFGILKDIAEFVDIRENENVRLYEECPAILYCYESTSDNTIFDYEHKIASYIEEHDLEIAGDIVTQILYSKYDNRYKNDTFWMRHLLWIPICNTKKK